MLIKGWRHEDGEQGKWKTIGVIVSRTGRKKEERKVNGKGRKQDKEWREQEEDGCTGSLL